MSPVGVCYTNVTIFKCLPLSFDNAWTHRNADCCVNTVDETVTTATNFVNFGLVTPEILWLIYMGGEGALVKIRSKLVFKRHSLGGSSL